MKRLFLTSIIVFYSIVSQAEKYDWIKWRGEKGNGISQETKWNPKALDGKAKIKWKKNVGKGYASVCVEGEYLFTMGNARRKDTVFCLDVKTGQIVWKYSYPCTLGSYPGPRATPVIDGKYLYTMSRSGDVFCFHKATGKIQWQIDLEKLDIRLPKWGLSSSPLIYKSLIILNVGLSGIAISKKTGKIKWSSDYQAHPGYATPVIFSYKDKELLAIFGGEALYIVRPLDGEVICEYSWETNYKVNAADPIIKGDTIFISSGYEQGAALLKFTNNKLVELWKNQEMNNHFSTSVLLDGYIYGLDGQTWGDAAIKCIHLESGKVMWKQKHKFGSLMATANNKIIFLDDKGVLFILEASPKGYKKISQAKVLNPRRGAKCWTTPIICNGMIFCRSSAGDIVCVDVSK